MQASLERLKARRAELQDEGGFTLIELLIVVVILGILAAIVVFAVQNLSSTSVQSACESNFKTVETAVEAYKAQMSQYPSGSAKATGATGTGSTGASPTTDTDIGTVVTFTTGAIPAYGAAATGGTMVNAAGSVSGGTSDELLVQSGTPPNNTLTGQTVGPWLKDVPANPAHYTIFVANDGSGHIAVLDAAGKVVAGDSANVNDASACKNIS